MWWDDSSVAVCYLYQRILFLHIIRPSSSIEMVGVSGICHLTLAESLVLAVIFFLIVVHNGAVGYQRTASFPQQLSQCVLVPLLESFKSRVYSQSFRHIIWVSGWTMWPFVSQVNDLWMWYGRSAAKLSADSWIWLIQKPVQMFLTACLRPESEMQVETLFLGVCCRRSPCCGLFILRVVLRLTRECLGW